MRNKHGKSNQIVRMQRWRVKSQLLMFPVDQIKTLKWQHLFKTVCKEGSAWSKLFEPRIIIRSVKLIVQVVVALRKIIVGDWCFDGLSGGHLQSQVKHVCQVCLYIYIYIWFTNYNTYKRWRNEPYIYWNVSHQQYSFWRLQEPGWSTSHS